MGRCVSVEPQYLYRLATLSETFTTQVSVSRWIGSTEAARDFFRGYLRLLYDRFMQANTIAFIARRWSVSPDAFTVDLRPLQGGLVSDVARATITTKRTDVRVPRYLVVKELRGSTQREADIYAWLWTHLPTPPAARLLGVEAAGDKQFMYLEAVETLFPWAWSDTTRIGAVCRALARLHDTTRSCDVRCSWDYERELQQSADDTLATAMSARAPEGRRYWRRPGDLRRVVRRLGLLRARLLGAETTFIHGDMHSGNVILRGDAGDGPVALIDWARGRIGSPMEDIASWLHSLGCWEPQARKRHDTLLRAYLSHRRVPPQFDTELRTTYWFASASNGLSGAIRYHLNVLSDATATELRLRNSEIALRAWERVIRRAAALLNASGSG
jgi:aminoglycoside phosphotransferase (APT) family kinase protein